MVTSSVDRHSCGQGIVTLCPAPRCGQSCQFVRTIVEPAWTLVPGFPAIRRPTLGDAMELNGKESQPNHIIEYHLIYYISWLPLQAALPVVNTGWAGA